MSPSLPGQRSAQTPTRAAVAASRVVGRAVRGRGGLSSELHVFLTNEEPYVLSVDDNGQEIKTCMTTGAVTCEGRAQAPAEEV